MTMTISVRGFVALFLSAMLAGASIAQQAPGSGAPAGNAHPAKEIVHEGAAPTTPFGPQPSSPTLDAARKAEFASGLDLGPLRSLAVLHNGRVKILDTLADETVGALTGRSDFVDFLITEHEGGHDEVKKIAYDPVFTLLDMIIDPAFYVREPLIHIDFLPLREAYLERAFPTDEDARLRWKKLTRISPAMVEAFSTPIFQDYSDETPYRDGIQRAERANSLFKFGASNLLMIAPATKGGIWHNLAEAPPSSPVAVAATEMGEAWRAGDAARTNEAIRTLAAELPKINPELYPTTRRSLELAYNRSNAFEWGYWVYLLSLVSLLLAFGTGRRWLVLTGITLLIGALVLHSFGFVTRCLIAERFAIQNQFESMTGLSLFAALVGTVIMFARKQWLFGAAAAACGFLVLITATKTGIPGQDIGREAAILNTSVLLKYHVTTVLTSYGLITLGFVVSLFYLATYYGAKLLGRGVTPAVALGALGGSSGGSGDAGVDADIESTKPSLARSLADLDTAQMIILQLAFWTLGVGILLGAWWADHSWGRWWAFDPKETWALITWIVYLIVIHLRFATRNRGLVTAWLSVAGFIVMLWTYFGVNLLLPGLHAYA